MGNMGIYLNPFYISNNVFFSASPLAFLYTQEENMSEFHISEGETLGPILGLFHVEGGKKKVLSSVWV